MQSAYGYFSLFGIAVVLIILWTFALVWIWQDADETYGWLWALLMILFPGVTLVAYLITKRFTHRTVNEDLQAWEQRQSRHGWGWSIQSERQADEHTTQAASSGKFKPFSPGFSASVEEFVDKKPDWAKRDDEDYR